MGSKRWSYWKPRPFLGRRGSGVRIAPPRPIKSRVRWGQTNLPRPPETLRDLTRAKIGHCEFEAMWVGSGSRKLFCIARPRVHVCAISKSLASAATRILDVAQRYDGRIARAGENAERFMSTSKWNHLGTWGPPSVGSTGSNLRPPCLDDRALNLRFAWSISFDSQLLYSDADGITNTTPCASASINSVMDSADVIFRRTRGPVTPTGYPGIALP